MIETGPVPRSPAAQARSRMLALGVGVLALAGLLGGVFTHKVLVDQAGDLSVQCGLKVCDSMSGDATTSTSTLDLVDLIREGGGQASSVWGYAGTIAWWSALVAVLGITLALLMVGTRKYIRIPGLPPTTIMLVAGGIAMIGACIFVASKPESIGVTRIGWTFWSFGLGAVCTIAGAFMLSRQLALLEPEFDPGESPPDLPDEPWQEP
jgi:hypothetical protein